MRFLRSRKAGIPLPKEEEVRQLSEGAAFHPPFPRRNQWNQPVVVEETAVEDDVDCDQPVEPAPSQPGRARRRRLRSDASAAATRQMAKTMVGGIQTGRRVNERIGGFLQKFLPRLLPGSDANKPFSLPTYALIFIAVVIPVAVVTVASIVYLRFGQSIQYDDLFAQAA